MSRWLVKSVCFCVWPLLIWLCLLCSSALAGEIRIVDAAGLIRGAKRTSGPAKVEVRLGQPEPLAVMVSLVNLDGLSLDLSAQRGEDGQFVFERVLEGTWQLKVDPENLAVREVRILY